MDTIKDLIMGLVQNPINYSVKNWLTLGVIVAVLWHFGLLPI